jgi:hypothetical protein
MTGGSGTGPSVPATYRNNAVPTVANIIATKK